MAEPSCKNIESVYMGVIPCKDGSWEARITAQGHVRSHAFSPQLSCAPARTGKALREICSHELHLQWHLHVQLGQARLSLQPSTRQAPLFAALKPSDTTC